MKKTILLDLGLISLVLLLGGLNLLGEPMHNEVRELFSLDIGYFIAAIGTFWTVGAFFKITHPVNLGISLACGLATFIFGCALANFGIFHAIALLGGFMLFLCICTYTVNQIVGLRFLVAGIVLLAIGLPLRCFSTPTGAKFNWETESNLTIEECNKRDGLTFEEYNKKYGISDTTPTTTNCNRRADGGEFYSPEAYNRACWKKLNAIQPTNALSP